MINDASHEMINDEAVSRELLAELNDDAQPLMVIKRENDMSNSFLETNLWFLRGNVLQVKPRLSQSSLAEERNWRRTDEGELGQIYLLCGV